MAKKEEEKIMTVEENIEFSGFGSKFITLLSENTDILNLKYKIISLGKGFIEHGSRKELLEIAGFSEDGFEKAINAFFLSDSEKIKIRYSAF